MTDHLELGEHQQNWEDEMSWDADDVDDEEKEKDEDKEKENWEYVCESNPKFEVCPKCRGTLDYCYGLDDEEWKCEDCNTKWIVPLVRAWSLIREVTA